MSKLDTQWTAYLHLQIQSGKRWRMDAKGWGLEAGLNHILVGQLHEGSAAAATERGAARERYHARLRFQYFDSHQVDDPTAQLDDIDRLHNLLASVCRDDRRMLLATGFGHDSAAVASIVSIKPDAVRKKVARLRANHSKVL